jgi:hypothetical protein
MVDANVTVALWVQCPNHIGVWLWSKGVESELFMRH